VVVPLAQLLSFLRRPEAPGADFDTEIRPAEREAIQARRLINGNRRNRPGSELTGVALSGGGIRSASVGLGALQGLEVGLGIDGAGGIDGIDYLSTVSGGGYTGCALTNAMQLNNGRFPFTAAGTYSDTDAVRHIRDFSNYLVPRGGTDIVTALGIILRGLAANVMVVLPVILFFTWITLYCHWTADRLRQPMFLQWNVADWFGHWPDWFWSLRGFWFTIIVLAVDVIFLMFWVLVKSTRTSSILQSFFPHLRPISNDPELQGGLATISKVLFFVTLTTAVLEFQPFILSYVVTEGPCPVSVASAVRWCSSELHATKAVLEKSLNGTTLATILGSVGALFSKYLADVVQTAKRSSGFMAWLKKFLAQVVIWLAAAIVPLYLWLAYLTLTVAGIHLENEFFSQLPGVNCLSEWLPWSGQTHAARVYFAVTVFTSVVALFVNPNATSLFRLYRDRLSKAFLFDPKPDNRDPVTRDLAAEDPRLHQINTSLCPYPIINAALNIEGSRVVNRRGRNADFFMFTPKYVGSEATSYVATELMEREEPTLDLGMALAISGAAISSNMGSATIRPLSLTLALLNIRLGKWLFNPRWVIGYRTLLDRLRDPRNFPFTLLFREMFNLIDEKTSTVYLTDGGNIENLGVYSLLKRRCPVIIAVDAEADPTMSFSSFLTLERYARIDLGVIIDLPWQQIKDRTLAVDKIFDDGKEDQLTAEGPHCAAGEIDFGDGTTGVLLYVKASLTGDESDYVLNYKKRNSDFPHETTGDQFFGEEQLEVYRALGFHMMRMVLDGSAPFAVKPGPRENEAAARQRILTRIRTAAGL
jgi:hypothetical protein